MSKVKVDIPPKSIDNFFDKLDKGLDDCADMIFELSQDQVAVDRGMLKKSGFVIRDYLHKYIGYDSPEGPWVEFGTDPHMPPFEPILQWVKRKSSDFGIKKSEAGKVAKAIQYSISKNGTKEHPFLRPAFDDVQVRARTIIMKHFR